MKSTNLLLILCAALLTGCAVGNQYGFKPENVGLPISRVADPIAVAVSVEDNRPYVRSGQKDPNFVGLQRGGFGNPFNVTTSSGRPFAEDVAGVLSTLLERSGYPSSKGGTHKDLSSVVAELTAKGLERGVHLNILEWKTDIYMQITLHFDLELSIIDKTGNVLAKSRQQGVEAIGGGMISERGNSETASLALSTKLSYLFLDPGVQAALK